MKVSREGAKIILEWSVEDDEDVKKAREFFIKLTRQGWFAAVHDGIFRRVLEFREEYGKLWFIPLSEGG